MVVPFAVARSRAALRRLFREHPGLRLPSATELRTMAGTLYTPNQVATLMQVHPQTIGRWLRNGYLRGSQIGEKKEWRIHEDALREYMEARDIPCDTLPTPEELDARKQWPRR